MCEHWYMIKLTLPSISIKALVSTLVLTSALAYDQTDLIRSFYKSPLVSTLVHWCVMTDLTRPLHIIKAPISTLIYWCVMTDLTRPLHIIKAPISTLIYMVCHD